MKTLAIKGDKERGNEVIALLEMLGGANSAACGYNEDLYYFMGVHNIIDADNLVYDGVIIFTLEEFLEKYPFKVGDKVIDVVDGCPGVVSEMKWDKDVSDMKYCVVFGNGIDFGWFTNDSIEFCKENENLEETKVECMIINFDICTEDEVELKLGDYEIEVRDGKTYAVKKKPKYPKLTNLYECKEILGEKDMYQSVRGYKGELLTNFQRLLIFRDAYWKIAGEQMGLDKPWVPEWKNTSQIKHSIWFDSDGICMKSNRTSYAIQHVLSFPTTEMRDAFYENFKDLIEKCKELL